MPRPSELLVQMMVELAAGKRADSLRELGRWLDNLNGQTDPVTQTLVGGGGAPANASYVTIANTPDLSRERALSAADPLTLTDGGANGSVTIGIDADAFDARYLKLDASNDPLTGALDIKTDSASAFRVLTAAGAAVLSVDTVSKIATVKGTQRLTAVASTESLDRTVTSESGGAGVAENIVSTVNNTYPVLRYGPTGTPPFVGSSFEFLAADNAHRLLFMSQADGFGVPTYNVISSDYHAGGGSVVPLVFRVGSSDWEGLPNLLTLTNANARLDGRLEVHGSSAVVDIVAPDTAGIYSVLHLYDSGSQGWAITKNPTTRDLWINKDTSYGGYSLTALAIQYSSGRVIVGPVAMPSFSADANEILHVRGAASTSVVADGTVNGQFKIAANGVNQWAMYSANDTVLKWYKFPATSGDVMSLTSAGALVTIGTVQGTQLISTIATGTAPLSVTSTTAVSNLNADLLDGQHASAFAAAGNYITALTGDVTASGPGSAAATLATVNSNVGSYGSATQVATFTVNAKGLITAAGNTTISGVTPATHDMVSAHTYTGGAALDVFGLSAANTIAKLTPSSAPGAVSSILKSDANGYLQLVRLGAGVAPNESIEVAGNIRLPATTSTTGIIKSGTSTFIHVYGTNNTFLGVGAGNLTLTGTANTVVGSLAGRSLTNGVSNVFIGYDCGGANQGGGTNVAIGYSALAANTAGGSNFALGFQTLFNSTGDANVAIGRQACYTQVNVSNNVGIGYQTLFNAAAGNNVAIGRQAGYTNSSGSGNVFLGYLAGYRETASNTLIIDNTTHGSEAADRVGALLYGTFNADASLQTLTVNALLTARMNTAATNAVVEAVRVEAKSSGTAAAGFGVKQLFQLQSSTTASQTAAYDERLWTDPTHASRTVLYRGTTTGNTVNTGFYGAWAHNAVSNTAITIIPDGTGDVASVGSFVYTVKDNTSATTSGGVVVLNPGGSAVSLLSDGTDTLQITCAANGSVTIVRSAGSHTFSVSLWGTWQ